MKRIFLIVYCMIAVLCNSHAQHFEFMGIPIDGSLEAFDAKLKIKGFVKSKDFGEFDTKTERYYDGRFAGEDIFLTVSSAKINKVYSACVYRYFKTLDSVKERWEYYVSVIEDKYKDKIINKNIRNNKNIRYEMELGDIIVRYNESEFGDDKYVLYLLYIDRKNSIINNAINRGDI